MSNLQKHTYVFNIIYSIQQICDFVKQICLRIQKTV